ncbi:MAG: hypothetical protein JXR03_13165 [Cyclobacteriaceae bacterium]
MKLINNVLAFTALVFLFAQCSNNKKPEQNAEEKKQELEAFVEKTFEYPIPTSFEVSKMLEEANAEFQPDIVNPAENATNYIAEWKKAINLGIYGADLSYSSTFNQSEQTMQYLKVSKQLVEDLNITTAFNMNLVNRIESNIENKDSLIMIVTESFYDTYNYLNRNGDEKTSVLVVAGSVIEGLYITTKLIEKSENKADLMSVLANQKEQVQKLTVLLENHATDVNVAKVLPNLRYINLFYEQLGNSSEITEGQFADVSSSISQIRWDLVD